MHFYKFKKGHQPITNSEEDAKFVQFAGTHFEWVGGSGIECTRG